MQPLVILPVRGTEDTIYPLLERMGIEYRRAEHSMCGPCIVVDYIPSVMEWLPQLAADTDDQVYMVMGNDSWVDLYSPAGHWIIHCGRAIQLGNEYIVE